MPDLLMLRDHLARAEEHVARSDEHIAKQLNIVADLERSGLDTSVARAFLEELRALRSLHVADRDRLRRELTLAQPQR